MISPLVIQECLFHERIEEIRSLRREVWASIPEFHIEYLEQHTQDSHDLHALHWVALDHGRVVAAARMCLHIHPEQIPDAEYLPKHVLVPDGCLACITRLVILPEYRNYGLGSLLTSARIKKARALHADKVLVRPFLDQEKRLKLLGFQDLAVAEMDPCTAPIVEKFMILDLNAKALPLDSAPDLPALPFSVPAS